MERTKSTCTSKPDCPCPFCVRVRAEMKTGKTPKDEINSAITEFMQKQFPPKKT